MWEVNIPKPTGPSDRSTSMILGVRGEEEGGGAEAEASFIKRLEKGQERAQGRTHWLDEGPLKITLTGRSGTSEPRFNSIFPKIDEAARL